MEIPGMLHASMVDSFASLPASLFDPKYWGPIVAIFVLVVLFSIASSVNRVKKDLASISSELSTIRLAIKKIQWSVERLDASRPPDAAEEKGIGELRFRFEDDRRERER